MEADDVETEQAKLSELLLPDIVGEGRVVFDEHKDFTGARVGFYFRIELVSIFQSLTKPPATFVRCPTLSPSTLTSPHQQTDSWPPSNPQPPKSPP